MPIIKKTLNADAHVYENKYSNFELLYFPIISYN